MDRNAWLITHDNFIDRRIFFFAEVLKKKGFAVKLFASHYFDLLSDCDPLYVERPVNSVVVSRFQVDFSQSSPEIATMLHHLVEAQEIYFEQQGRYSDKVKSLGVCVMPGFRVQCTVHDSFYIILLRKKQSMWVYSSATGKVQVCEQMGLQEESQSYIQAIYQYITKYKSFHDQAFSIGNINVRMDVDIYGEESYYAQNPGLNFYYKFSPHTQLLEKIQAIPFRSAGQDVVKEKSFDFEEYKKIVYDYSPILERVKRELETETPDLVYVADLPTLPIGVMLKRTVDCKLMIDCHEWWFKQARLWESDFAQKVTLSERYEAELYPQCDVCITVGEYLAADMGKCYGRKFETIYSCMSASLSAQPSDFCIDMWATQFSIPQGSRVAVFQGSMTTLRNLDNLARATKYLSSDSFLVVVGGGPYEAEFKKILNKEGNPEQVRFAGWVKQTELMRYTVNAHLGVLPYSAMDEYFSYSVPNKLMEYFEATMPMLYDISMKEISMVAGENNVGVGEDLSNPELFGKQMDQLLHDEAKLQTLRENYRNCKDKFRFEKQGEHFEEVLNMHFPQWAEALAEG